MGTLICKMMISMKEPVRVAVTGAAGHIYFVAWFVEEARKVTD
jgi:hypothetical protein